MSEPIEIQIDTRPTKRVVVESLVKDISIEACILDLIDNSIDAINEVDGNASKKKPLAGFEISVSLSYNEFKITDNGIGISTEKFKKHILRFGDRSHHKNGIGVFGVGLNRALFKLGKGIEIDTENDSFRTVLSMDVNKYILDDDDWSVPSKVHSGVGVSGTTIRIGNLFELVTQTFSDQDWIKEFTYEIGLRYSISIEKGLSIFLNGNKVIAGLPKLRKQGPFSPKSGEVQAGPAIGSILYGEHALHRFAGEVDYSAEQNKEITQEYGWYVICNDRAVLLADTTVKTGNESFHSQYYGFVGFIYYKAEDPEVLPWNTTKSDINPDSPAYQASLPFLRLGNADWRSYVSKRKTDKDAKSHGTTPSQPRVKQNPSNPISAGSARRSPKTVPISTTVLPFDVDEQHCRDKVLNLVKEAKVIDYNITPYTAAALVRILFENSALHFFKKRNLMTDLSTFVASRKKKSDGSPLTAEEVKKVQASLDDMLAFLEIRHVEMGRIAGPQLLVCVRRLKSHQGLMNGIMHNAFQRVSQLEAATVCEDAIPVIRIFVEMAPLASPGAES